jgi:hypothetical protein
MGKFLESEKPKQAEFKINSPDFSIGARDDGIYRDHLYPFCLPRDDAHENLFPDIQHSALEFFANNQIKWHDGQEGKPSNHLCDSQVCCVNFLFPFSDKPKALTGLISTLYPGIKEMLPIEGDRFVTFEWIGQKNYLGEKVSRNGKRTRGANFTSADAAIMFHHNDGRKQIVLIEWKYTESYYSTYLKYAKSGTDRTAIYAHLYDNDEEILDKELLPGFDSLFYEPFYQLMRQQYLAAKMEEAHELGVDQVSLLHIAPAQNIDFKRITSPDLRHIGESATSVWSALVKKSDRFQSVSTEELFGTYDTSKFPELNEWKDYITSRYSWLVE